MINIKELSVGNWVENTNGNTGKVIGITEQGEVIMRYSENSTCYSEPRVLEPVEITPEILEKNGFEKREFINEVNCKEEYWIYCNDYYSLVISEINDGLYKVEHHIEELINLIERLYISYVHQLQNALTLCGINKNIEL